MSREARAGGFGGESSTIDRDATRLEYQQPVGPRVHELSEEPGIVGGHRRGTGESRDDFRREPLLEQRKQLVAHTVARNGHVAIRRVFPKLDFQLLEVFEDLGATDVEHRSHEPAATPVNGRQTVRTGAPEQAQQHGFRLIVARVSHRHVVGGQHVRCSFQKRVPGTPGRVLDGSPLGSGQLGHIRRLDHDRPRQPLGEGAAERFVAVRRLTAQAVIQVGKPGEHNLFPAVEIEQHAGERHRIGAARESDGHPAAWRDQSVPANGSPDTRDQRMHGMEAVRSHLPKIGAGAGT